ncbi:MAG: DUF4115 domain-containing protein [Chloroflexota bacterium]|nr:DUF4115 domain-containing protein [Chloroflexota bacterium]
MPRLGEILRAQRERKKITLDQAADDTRIRERFLRALEDGDYESLPGAVYTKGFVSNYAEYLDLPTAKLVALYRSERPAAEAPRRFEPMRPIARRGLVLRPSVLLPVAATVAVVMFVGYLYYQLSTFAVLPKIDVTDPPVDAVAQSGDYVVKGRTTPDARITVRVFPGPETYADIRPDTGGGFSVKVQLRPGTNHIEVEVLAQGKVDRVSRAIRLDSAAADAEQAPQLIVEQPANGGTYTNAPVTVSGRVDRSVASLLVNGTPVAPATDGTFTMTVNFAAGQQTIHVVARTARGAEVQETRTVGVSYSAAVVTVRVQGGPAWLVATVDGAQAPNTNKVFADGQVLSFSGKRVVLRTGNAGTTYVTYNGLDVGRMGAPGQVIERAFATP